MIRGGFLSAEDRRHLIALARDGSAASRLTRRANALALLDDGRSCQEVGSFLSAVQEEALKAFVATRCARRDKSAMMSCLSLFSNHGGIGT
jgi:hypothetical protein